MAQAKLPIKDILGAIDMGAKNVWDEFTDEEKKSVSFWLLNRYVSSVKGSTDDQSLAVFKTNEYYNKNYMVVSKHTKLMWQLLCMSGNTQKIQYHNWQGFKKKPTNSTAGAIKLFQELYPNMKQYEVEMLAGMHTKKELKQIAEDHNIQGIKL
jgi:hypothetical protein|tara:strand:- start:687 stop:1145 length:459 start_codon:yes stop_codon:yes gene_type:complete